MDEQMITFTLETCAELLPEPRLDVFLTEKLPQFSRTRVQALIKEGRVLVNGKLPKKAGQLLEPGDITAVTIPPIQAANIIPEKMPLDILFENEHVIVLNKPPGVVVHPSPGHETGTLVNAVLAHVPEIEGVGGVHRPGVVHRLDKDTSGVILMAKNDRAHRMLQDQFRDRAVRKLYLALVEGVPPTPTGLIEAAITRDIHRRERMAVVAPAEGREAVTEYRIVEWFNGFTLVEAHPRTGRTHQIRVHMAFLHCPVAGDTVYGARKVVPRLVRTFLHAAQLTLRVPGEEAPMTFRAPLAPDLERVLELLRR